MGNLFCLGFWAHYGTKAERLIGLFEGIFRALTGMKGLYEVYLDCIGQALLGGGLSWSCRLSTIHF